MQALATITEGELQADSSARLWALVSYLAEHAVDQTRTELRPFWLVYMYDSEVLNGGHLQYFHNQGTDGVMETIEALHRIGAHEHAALLVECWAKIRERPVSRVASLEEYSQLAGERSFAAEDNAYYALRAEVLPLLQEHYASLLRSCVAVEA